MDIPSPPTLSRFSRTALHVCTVLIALIGIACIGASRRSFSGTFDESNHLATGLEWWQFGTYTLWTENPPLARVAVAALPYLHGMRLPAREQWEPKTHDWDRSWEIGTDLLYEGDGFETNLTRARLGTLPFFVVALFAVWGLAGGRRRPTAGLVAVALTATLPTLIAHGALATTDVAFAAMFLLAILTLLRWFERPTVPRALVLGTAVGLALLTKFSTLAFFPIAVVAVVGARRIAGASVRPSQGDFSLHWSRVAGHWGLALMAGFTVTWAGYGFSVGPMDALLPEVKGWLRILPPVSDRNGITGLLLRVPLPMPELFHGLRFLVAHDGVGHEAYLLGKTSEHGFLAFYPIALLVKTPLPFLALLVCSLPLLAHRRRTLWTAQAVALAAFGILLISLRSHVNLGIRHVFVLLPLLAVAVARVIDEKWMTCPAPGAKCLVAAGVVGALLLAQAGGAIAARKTQLGYFNALAGSDPATILLDSDLDWGQDLFALRQEAHARGIDTLKLAYFGTLRQCRHGLPALKGLEPGKATTGWIAISENYYRHRSTFLLLKDPCNPKSTYKDAEIPPLPFAWLQAHKPVAIAGSSLRLYHIVP